MDRYLCPCSLILTDGDRRNERSARNTLAGPVTVRRRPLLRLPERAAALRCSRGRSAGSGPGSCRPGRARYGRSWSAASAGSSRPTAAKSCRTVVSGGQKAWDSSMSSNPDHADLVRDPAAELVQARMTPSAISSFAAKIAVTSRASPSSARRSIRTVVRQSPYSTGGGHPASSSVRRQDSTRWAAENEVGSGDVPHLPVAEFQRDVPWPDGRPAPGRCPPRCRPGPGSESTTTIGTPAGAGLRVVQEMRLEDEDHPVDGRLAEPVRGAGRTCPSSGPARG